MNSTVDFRLFEQTDAQHGVAVYQHDHEPFVPFGKEREWRHPEADCGPARAFRLDS